MAREYLRSPEQEKREAEQRRVQLISLLASAGAFGLAASPAMQSANPSLLFSLGLIPALAYARTSHVYSRQFWLERERRAERERRGGKDVLGMPPERHAFAQALADAQSRGKAMIDKYLVGFDLNSGSPLWMSDNDMCSHGCVFAKTGVGKTLFLESLIFQQMARGRASGCTFIDAKRDSGTLADIILMALVTGRIEDLIIIDPFDSIHAYNFVMTNQRADVKARKVLRAGLPPTSDASTTKHYDRLAADSIYRMVRALESFGLAWSIHDIAVALSAFNLAYPRLRELLRKIGARQALVELGHLASSYRTGKGTLDTSRITDNLRGIASELHAIAGSQMGSIFCTQYTDLNLTDAILRGKIIYFMLPRLEEAESAARMVKLFREDLEVSIGEITSSRHFHLEDPHLVIIDEGSSTFGPTWANLFELARKGRFSLLFGAQSTGGLTDSSMGLSEAFYERVMANVNLKVMMRIGDNRTATEMAEWFGKVATTKKSVAAGMTTSRLAAGTLDLGARRGAGESQSINISEDEEDLVSSEELKHEMSSEKGLAWFDLGDGRIIKGRAFWFNSDLPQTWEGREFITRFERYEDDEIGLAAWVDEQVYHMEHQDAERGENKRTPSTEAPASESKTGSSATTKTEGGNAPQEEKTPSGPFRLNMQKRGSGPPRGAVTAISKEQQKGEQENAGQKSSTAADTEQSANKTPDNTSPQEKKQDPPKDKKNGKKRRKSKLNFR